MIDLDLRRRSPPLIENVLHDPTASFALKTVLRAWAERDCLDAALDAIVLSEVFEAELARRFENEQ